MINKNVMKRLRIKMLLLGVLLSVVTLRAEGTQADCDTLELSEKQVASLVYAEMILKSKPDISIDLFEEGEYRMSTSDNSKRIVLSPKLSRAYFVNYDNGNSDLIIPAKVHNSLDIDLCRMVVYNRRDEVFYEIETLLPKPSESSRMEADTTDLSLLPKGYNGMLVTFHQNGKFSWWAKFKDGKKTLTSEKKMSNDEYYYKKFAAHIYPRVYNPSAGGKELYDPILRKYYNNPLVNRKTN